MSPNVEKIDKWHFAQSLLKWSQIIESTHQREGGDKSIKEVQNPLESDHTSIVVSHLINQAASQVRHW